MNGLMAILMLLTPQEAPEEDLFQWARDLDDVDLSWQWGNFFFTPSGQLDLEFFLFGDGAPGVSVEDPALRSGKYSRGDSSDSPAALGRLQIFLDGGYSDWVEGSIEARIDGTTGAEGAAGARIEQLWIRLAVSDDPFIRVQVGKFAAPIGNFIPRSASRKNPLTTWPLAYDLPTSLTSIADTGDLLRAVRDEDDIKDWYVPIWQGVYGWGLMGTTAVGDLDFSLSLQTSAPATLPEDWDHDPADPDFANLYLHGGYSVHPTTKLGASFSRGPYEKNDNAGGGGPGPGPLPPASPAVDHPEDFDQTLIGLDAAFATGRLELFCEFFWTELETPNADDLDLATYYVEGKYAFTPELFGAARFGQMFFGDAEDSTGASFRWDRNTTRIEIGGGYFFTSNLFAKTTIQQNFHHGGPEPEDWMLAIQFGLGF